MPFYAARGREERLRSRRPRRARGDPGEPLLHLPHRARAPTARPGSTVRVGDVDLASRLSFFLWGTPPDEELLSLADQRQAERSARARAPGAAHARRSARSGALGTRFAAQWLRLQDLDKVHPDPNFYPNFDENLADGDAPRDGDVLQQPGAGRPQLPRPVSRRLHLRERAAGAALRHPGRGGHGSSARCSTPTPRAAACSGRAACWSRPRSPTAPRRCCAASGSWKC